MIVLTGGPSAGKTAVIEMLRRMVCPHVAVLPESAGILFGGGFWRLATFNGRLHAQRAIYHVQSELERMAGGEELFQVAVCDRGTLDGMAYWPRDGIDFLENLGITRADEMRKYSMVVHLRTPPADEYNRRNPLRTETAEAAHVIDQRIEEIWNGHPNRVFVENNPNFMDKARAALRLIVKELPDCCAPMQALKAQFSK
jgi:hypothetical protein